MKSSFILHLDSLEILEDLTNDQAAQLFRAIYDYNRGKEPTLDAVVKMVFLPFRNQFDRDKEKYQKRVEVNRANGSKGGKRKVANASKRKRKVANLADNDSVNDSDKDINIPFEQFWILYDYKKGDKSKIEKKWNKLTNDDRIKIIAYIPQYKLSTPDKKFRKHPETFLNNKSWNDEIITTITPPTQTPLF